MLALTLEGSNSFQPRVPDPSISGMAAAVDAIFDPYNNDLYNEFSGLLNGIMMTYVYSRRFENPLREIKKPARTFGNTERMVAVNYMKAHAWKFDDETLLKTEKPEYVEWFFSVDYKTRFEFCFNRVELRRVFSEDGYGFNELLSATLDAQISSDQLDEMNTMLQMFSEADSKWGLFRYNLSAAPTDKATAQELLVGVRAMAGRLKFPSTYYNGLPVPVFESNETLVFYVTPEVDAVIDVMALAELFNIDRAEVRFRKIIVPEFPIPGVYAALASEDFIYFRDVEYGVYPFFNPSKLEDKYYLHHWAMVGANPAANCILFTTDEGTSIPTVTVTPSSFAFSPDTGTVAPGGELQLHYSLLGSVSNDSLGLIGVEPDSATFEVAASRSGDAIPLNTRTYVDERGVLHVQKTGLEADDVITVTATAAYVDPSGIVTSTFTDTFTATVV